MKIAIVGTGYVGLVSGACFAEMGLDITCVDTDRAKIDALNAGRIPIYEPGLEELVRRNFDAGRLHFTTDLAACLDRVEVVFTAVGTPPGEDGAADLRHVEEVARTFGRHISRYTLLVTKSTVPVGTARRVREIVAGELRSRGADILFDVAANPEFLKEGSAIKDFMSPDRVVVGTDSERARQLMARLYRPFLINNFRVMFMDIASAEMTKYAANAMLATRISFMNDIANGSDSVPSSAGPGRRPDFRPAHKRMVQCLPAGRSAAGGHLAPHHVPLRPAHLRHHHHTVAGSGNRDDLQAARAQKHTHHTDLCDTHPCKAGKRYGVIVRTARKAICAMNRHPCISDCTKSKKILKQGFYRENTRYKS